MYCGSIQTLQGVFSQNSYEKTHFIQKKMN